MCSINQALIPGSTHSHSHQPQHIPPENDLQVKVQRLQAENRNLKEVLDMVVNMGGWDDMQSSMINNSNGNSCHHGTCTNNVTHCCLEEQYVCHSCHCTQQHSTNNMLDNNQANDINNSYFNTCMVSNMNMQENQRQEEQVFSFFYYIFDILCAFKVGRNNCQNTGDIGNNFNNNLSSQIMNYTSLRMENCSDIVMEPTSLPLISDHSSMTLFGNIPILPSIAEENVNICTFNTDLDSLTNMNVSTGDIEVNGTASTFGDFSFYGRSSSPFTVIVDDDNDIFYNDVDESF